jgi:hypothetical protein
MRNTILITFSLLLINHLLVGQEQFKVVVEETGTWKMIFNLVNEEGELIKQLDTAKYFSIDFNNEELGYFAIFGLTGVTGWHAIDVNENILFEVFNTSFGEPSPDRITENKIRIVNQHGKIGFANNKGRIVIEPQFEVATSFHNGFTIIGENCKKIPLENHEHETDCEHFSMICERHGYINENGKIIKIGGYTFEQIMKEINWKMPFD